jgi:hypothetical protein
MPHSDTRGGEKTANNEARVRAEPLDPAANLERKARRIERLNAEDPQFRDSFPLEAVAAAKLQPELRLAQVVRIVMDGYADRPALGQRARKLVTDPANGRRTLRLLPSFDTITYRELWTRSCAVASEWHHDGQYPLRAGDFVCILGFASTDYATLLLASIHLGAVIVPLQTSALQPNTRRSSRRPNPEFSPRALTTWTPPCLPFSPALCRNAWWSSTMRPGTMIN